MWIYAYSGADVNRHAGGAVILIVVLRISYDNDVYASYARITQREAALNTTVPDGDGGIGGPGPREK